MRTIKQTTRFTRDLKREKKGRYRTLLKRGFTELVETLAQDKPLAARYQDHALTGEWRDHRDCHIKPDLVLIYSKTDTATMCLVRLGSHSELGL